MKVELKASTTFTFFEKCPMPMLLVLPIGISLISRSGKKSMMTSSLMEVIAKAWWAHPKHQKVCQMRKMSNQHTQLKNKANRAKKASRKSWKRKLMRDNRTLTFSNKTLNHLLVAPYLKVSNNRRTSNDAVCRINQTLPVDFT